MSSRKNNTKSKKTTSKNHSEFNNFRMEALEPRLLMSPFRQA